MSQPSETETRVQQSAKLQIGEWSICQAEGSLSSNGRSVRLEPRVMDLLAYLAAHRERVVSKEELMAAVWGGAFVEEGVLSQAVHSLRKVLGDDARQPRYVQTIPKRGYRLVAPVIPEGETEKGLPPPASWTGVRVGSWGQLFFLATITIAAAVFLWLAGERLGIDERDGKQVDPGAAAGGTRIVVLPFENLGKPEHAFFADGLTEEITKDLASFPSLQVISRTSAMRYKGIRRPLSEIGRELRVDYVLEGTVRWAEGLGGRSRVRITPQLIRVADDIHVWADAFEREMGDIFEVQAEISRRVISQLGITLMPRDKEKLRAHPTENLEAYQAYLRGLEFKNQPFYSEEDLRKAVPMFERAVKLDPSFADAWAELSQAHSYLAFNSGASPSQVEEARQAMERAIAIEPNMVSVRLAQIYFTYRCLGKFDAAHGQVVAAVGLFPNDAEVLQAFGLILRRRGRLVEAIDAFRHAFSLDPRTVRLVWSMAETARALRDYKQSDRYFAQAISLAPDEPVFWEGMALNRLAWTDDLEQARAIIDDAPIPSHPKLMPAAFQLDLYERHFQRALAMLDPEKMRQLAPQVQSRIATLAAVARERSGDHRGALAAAEVNRITLEAQVVRFPREPFYLGYLAVALAQLGRKGEALSLAEEAVQQRRDDAFTGPRMLEIQAMVEMIVGNRHKAINRLARLLMTPYQSPISAAELRLSPIWDPLRDDPEFKKLVQGFAY